MRIGESSFNRAAAAATLQVLVGQRLATIGRAADMAWIGFGDLVELPHPRQPGQTSVVATHALHLQCPFRITRGHAVLVASGDIYLPRSDPHAAAELDQPFEWDVLGANRYDEGAEGMIELIRDLSPVVVAVEVDAFGGINLSLTSDIELSVFPDESLPREQWRYFRAGCDEAHLVVMEERSPTDS